MVVEQKPRIILRLKKNGNSWFCQRRAKKEEDDDPTIVHPMRPLDLAAMNQGVGHAVPSAPPAYEVLAPQEQNEWGILDDMPLPSDFQLKPLKPERVSVCEESFTWVKVFVCYVLILTFYGTLVWLHLSYNRPDADLFAVVQKQHNAAYERERSQFERDEAFIKDAEADHRLKHLISRCKSGTCVSTTPINTVDCEVYNRWEETVKCGIELPSNDTIEEEYFDAYIQKNLGGSTFGVTDATRRAVGKGLLPLISSLWHGKWITVSLRSAPFGWLGLLMTVFTSLPWIMEIFAKLFVLVVFLVGAVVSAWWFRSYGIAYAVIFAFSYLNFMGMIPWIDFGPTSLASHLFNAFLWKWTVLNSIAFTVICLLGFHFRTLPFLKWTWNKGLGFSITCLVVGWSLLFSIIDRE